MSPTDTPSMLPIDIAHDPQAVAERGAAIIAAEAKAAIAARGRCVLAVSGGHTPWMMLKALASEPLAWSAMHIVQVDERVAPAGDPDRNLTHLEETLLAACPLPRANLHAMPVELPEPESAARAYATTLHEIAGTRPTMDLVHLGLGPDGHTASLIPNDPVLEVTTADVAATGVYQGRRRVTLTYPVLNQARLVLWIVTGAEKQPMIARLRQGDESIPAGRVRAGRMILVADRAAAGVA